MGADMHDVGNEDKQIADYYSYQMRFMPAAYVNHTWRLLSAIRSGGAEDIGKAIQEVDIRKINKRNLTYAADVIIERGELGELDRLLQIAKERIDLTNLLIWSIRRKENEAAMLLAKHGAMYDSSRCVKAMIESDNDVLYWRLFEEMGFSDAVYHLSMCIDRVLDARTVRFLKTAPPGADAAAFRKAVRKHRIYPAGFLLYMRPGKIEEFSGICAEELLGGPTLHQHVSHWGMIFLPYKDQLIKAFHRMDHHSVFVYLLNAYRLEIDAADKDASKEVGKGIRESWVYRELLMGLSWEDIIPRLRDYELENAVVVAHETGGAQSVAHMWEHLQNEPIERVERISKFAEIRLGCPLPSPFVGGEH